VFPFQPEKLPDNGIYFFYEKGETWGHGGPLPRIVRIGTHKEGNFKSRISEHFLLDDRKMNFDSDHPAPHERSIFRKNIGRALLTRDNDEYLKVWEYEFTKRLTRQNFSHLRDVDKEKQIEAEITRILRQTFSFRYIAIQGQERRMGTEGLERALIGTVAGCHSCRPSPGWLGHHSPKEKVRTSGLWLAHHLRAAPITENDKATIERAVSHLSV
jgi:hypothetical protein